MTIPPNAQQIIEKKEDNLSGFIENSLGVMPEGLSLEEQEEFRARQLAQLQSTQGHMQTLFQANKDISETTEDAISRLPAIASSYFDLNKESQFSMEQAPMEQDLMEQAPMEQAPMEQAPMEQAPMEQTVNETDFDSHVDLFNYLESALVDGEVDFDTIRNELLENVGNKPTVDEQGIEQPNPQQVIADSFQEYIEYLPNNELDINKEKRAELARKMFEVMPQNEQRETIVQGIEEVVAESNELIRKLANSLAYNQINKQASFKKPFNLKKEAQHKTMEGVIMHGPQGNRIDPFTGQLINDWHVYERNKGWGLKMDDALFVDYEAIWRGNIMDKYSRPYRDKDGNYVGGYIEKRFEVDKWIPPGNNYQLKPGERRRPYLPEYRSTEARMQHMRANNTDEGRIYNDTTEPFDWSKAAKSNAKNIKTSQLENSQDLLFIVQDLQTGENVEKIDATQKDQALQQAQAIARERNQPVMLLTYDILIDDMDPLEEDMVYPQDSYQSVSASVNSKKKVN